MRIDRLEIRSPWKNLGGFTIDFDETRDVTVILGRNGSAKSNLLEAIIIIFSNINLGEPALFSYEIRYELRNRKVTLQADAGKQPKASIGGDRLSLTALRKEWGPKYVVGYYSGTSDRFEEIFRRHDRRALEETLKPARNAASPETLSFRQYIYARPEHGLFALLSFYFSDDKEVEDFLKRRPRIAGFDSALLVIKKPSWAKKNSSPDEFWGAQGPVRELLERIQKNSLMPFNRTVRVETNFRNRVQRDVMYLYIPNIEALHRIADEYGRNPRALFQALDTMRLSDLLDDLRVRVQVIGSSGSIHTRQLSEGEQQLLSVIGLMRFTRNESSLYVLDEPDTHLNPEWGVEYLNDLRRLGGIDRDSHTMLATHDPLLVAGLCRQEIRVLTRSADGRISATIPEKNPRGTGVASVLTSSLYGLESQLDLFSLEVLKRIYKASMEEPSAKRTRYLRRLRRLVPALEIIESSPDPYRNIAQEAFKIAIDNAVASNRKDIVDALATKLYNDAGGMA